MAFNSIGQYTANFKTWDHLGNIFPNIEHSEGTRPAGEFKVAAWLPVTFFDKYYEDWYVVTPGKIVAFDNNGAVCPAQYANSGAFITYTANDITAQTTDVNTGVTVTTAHTIEVNAVTTFLGTSGVSLAVSKPVGVAPYGYLQWAGGDGVNPTQLLRHNYNRQNLVAFLCDYVLTLPLVPGLQASETVTFGSPVSGISEGTLKFAPVAANTLRTPISFSGTNSSLFVNQQTVDLLGNLTVSIAAAGDWSINYSTGQIQVINTGSVGWSMTVSYYTYALPPATVSVFACAVGNLQPGDFVKCDTNGNFQKALETDAFQDVMGQVLEVVTFPRSGLQYVKTAFAPAINTSAAGSLPGYSGQMDQLPGTATAGMPDAVQFSGASNTLVHINLISR
jgi:hypothetical protein